MLFASICHRVDEQWFATLSATHSLRSILAVGCLAFLRFPQRDVDQIILDTCAWERTRCLSHVSISMRTWSDNLPGITCGKRQDSIGDVNARRSDEACARESKQSRLSESMLLRRRETAIYESVRRWRPLSSCK